MSCFYDSVTYTYSLLIVAIIQYRCQWHCIMQMTMSYISVMLPKIGIAHYESCNIPQKAKAKWLPFQIHRVNVTVALAMLLINCAIVSWGIRGFEKKHSLVQLWLICWQDQELRTTHLALRLSSSSIYGCTHRINTMSIAITIDSSKLAKSKKCDNCNKCRYYGLNIPQYRSITTLRLHRKSPTTHTLSGNCLPKILKAWVMQGVVQGIWLGHTPLLCSGEFCRAVLYSPEIHQQVALIKASSKFALCRKLYQTDRHTHTLLYDIALLLCTH